MQKRDGLTDRGPSTEKQKDRLSFKKTTAMRLHFPRRFLAWEKINSLIKSHTVPISKLGTTLAPSLKCLNPNRSQLIVQLKVEEDEEEEDRRSTAWSSLDPSYDDFSLNAWEGRGGGGGRSGSAVSIRRHQAPTGRKSPKLHLQIIRNGFTVARKTMNNSSIRVKGFQDYENQIIG